MPYYAMLLYASPMPYYAMLLYALPHALLCYAPICLTPCICSIMLCSYMPYPMPYYAIYAPMPYPMLYYAMLLCLTPCPILLCSYMPYPMHMLYYAPYAHHIMKLELTELIDLSLVLRQQQLFKFKSHTASIMHYH